MPVQLAKVKLWGREIGAVAWDPTRDLGAFEYTPAFQRSGIELAPIMMPLSAQVFTFPGLRRESYQGLPGLLADALPDRFGNLLIDEWLVRSGRDVASFSPVERLCYMGARGMGALEFLPALAPSPAAATPLEVSALVDLAAQALSRQASLQAKLTAEDDELALEALRDILLVGTSAGGARAKAVVAWNEESGEVVSGQVTAPPGFGYWLLKFDGVEHNRDKELADPRGYGKVEYAYSQLAEGAGIQMSECRLYHEHGRSHFMTRRFDRLPTGEKVFMQSLCALGHLDFNQAGAYGYEQALDLARRLRLGAPQLEQLFRRAVFNVMARNQDDHTKNIAFLMDKGGRWRLSPAFDVTFSYNPRGAWTSQHQMSINGKRDGFTRADLRACADRFNLFKRSRLADLLEQIDAALGTWLERAEQAGVPESQAAQIAACHRRLASLPD